MASHFEQEDRESQDEANPESAGHVDELGVGLRLGGHQLRLQRHAADRARARPNLPDLGMHGAGVDGALRHRLLLPWREIALGIGLELLLAPGAAEVIGAASVLGAILCGMGIDRHPADGIFGQILRFRAIGAFPQVFFRRRLELGLAAG